MFSSVNQSFRKMLGSNVTMFFELLDYFWCMEVPLRALLNSYLLNYVQLCVYRSRMNLLQFLITINSHISRCYHIVTHRVAMSQYRFLIQHRFISFGPSNISIHTSMHAPHAHKFSCLCIPFNRHIGLHNI